MSIGILKFFYFFAFPSPHRKYSKIASGSLIKSESRIQVGLLLLGSANGADLGTSAAVDAGISVDHVLAVAFLNSGDGAAVGASAAHDASIINLVSHDIYLLVERISALN